MNTKILKGTGAMAALLAFGTVGCANKMVKKPADTSAPAATTKADSGNDEPSMRQVLTQSIPELKTIPFAYDSSMLSASARKTLQGNAEWLSSHPEANIQITGNCDQRGTVEYNLALGQRRAQAVRDYYTHLGVDAARIATISYGKEKPLCQEANESCWSKNRRAETLEALPQAVGQVPSSR